MKMKMFALMILFSLLLASCAPAAATQPAAAQPTVEQAQPVQPTAEQAQPAQPTVEQAQPTVEQAQPAQPTVEQAQPTADQAIPSSGGQQPTVQLQSKELNLYAWSEYIPTELLDNFSKQYGVKVNYDTYSSNEELMAKLQAGASGYDVIIPSDYMVSIMAHQNLLEPLDLTQIPNLKNMDPKFLNQKYDPGNKFSVPYQWGTVGLVYNKTKVDPKPDSWKVLWDPKYKGRVVLLDDEREVLGMILTTLNFSKNSIEASQLEQAKAEMLKLLPNVKLFDSDSPKTALLTGEVWLGLTWNGEAALAHRENPDIEYTCPKEGCGLWFDNLAIPTGAPHKDAAQAFINFVLQPDQSLLITRDFPYSNPNKVALDLLKTQDPKAYDQYMNFVATNPSDADIQNAHMVEDVGNATTLWDDVWTAVKGNQ